MKIEEHKFSKLAELSLENSIEIILWIDSTGKIIFANKQASKAFGYSKNEFATLHISELSSKVRELGWDFFFNTVKNNEGNVFESIYTTKQKKQFPVEIRAHFIEYKNEGIVCVLYKDISERKKQEGKNKISNFISSSIENSREAIFFLKSDSSFEYVNAQACKYLGYSEKELLNLSLFNINPAFNAQNYETYFNRIKLGNTIEDEVYHKTKQGELIPVHVKSTYFKVNNVDYIRSHVVDITQNKINEAKLILQQEKYKSIYTKTPVMLHTIGEDTKLIEVSDFWLKKLGYTKEEVIGVETWKFMTQKSIADFDKFHYPKFLKTGFSENIEYEFVTKTGEVMDTLVSAVYIPKTKNSEAYTLTVITDITNYINALQSQEQKFKNLYAKTPAMMYSINKGGYLIQVSKFLSQRLGYSEAEMIGKKSIEFITKKSAKYALETGIPELFEKGFCSNVPYTFVSKKGELFDTLMSASVIYTKEGHFKEVLGVIVDITDFLKLKRIQKESIERERVLLNAIPDMMIRLNIEGKFIDYHASQEEKLYLKPEMFIGRNVYDIWPKELADFHMGYVSKAHNSGEIQFYEYEMPTQNGAVKIFESRILSIKLSNEVICIIRDVTQTRKQALTLEKSNKELEQYAYVATHDLKAPLTNIQGHFEYIKKAITHPDEETKESIYWIEDSIKQAQNKIESLVKVAKIRKKEEVSTEEVCLQDLIIKVITLFNDQLKKKQIVIKTELQKVCLETNKSKMFSILQNLISNSIKYYDKSKNEPVIIIKIKKINNKIVIFIEDNGQGIELVGRELKIFDMFTRYNTTSDGQGIGLFLVKKMMEQLGGTIHLESNIGIGTKISLHFSDNK